jgi:hypothetical protein
MKNSDAAADLRSVEPGDFVRARNSLAAKLQEDGKVAEARHVRRLRRPSPVVWALNNSASAPREVGALADAVARLRRAQLGQQHEFRPAMDRLRAAIAPIMHSASEKLRLARIPMSPALERRLRDTLIASVADRGLRADLLAGRLTEERGAAGFDILAKGPIPAVSPREKARKERPAERRRQLNADRESRKAAKRAQREARALNRVAEAKARAAGAAAAKVEAMRAALQELERRAADLQRAATEAREAALEAQRVHALSSAK